MVAVADVWPVVKVRLSLQDDNLKEMISTYIEEMGNRIKHYCNISSIPDGLKFTWASMTMDAVRIELVNVEEIADSIGDEGTLKIGDTQIGFSAARGGISNTSKSVIDDVVLNYRADLNHYRRLRW